MNGWTVALLVADLAGVTVAVVMALRTARGGGSGRGRAVRLAEAAVAGTLIALVAFRAADMPVVVVLLLVGVAVLAAASVRRFALAPHGSRPWAPSGNPWHVLPVVLSLIVVFAVFLWPGPTAEERDAATFGVPIDRHVTGVRARFLDHSPSLTDAGVPGGTAVPVERYALDGQLLTLVVLHNATCRLAVVLLASTGNGLDVVVVYGPSAATATRPSAGGASDVCRVDPADLFARRSALDVDLPAGLAASRVRDVGADGPALRR